MRPKKKTAFTIVELLVVVAIIALLVSIMVPAVQTAMDRAKDTAVKTQLYSIGMGLELFKSDYEQYPPSNDAAGPGSQLLCDYLVGTDLLGYIPDPNNPSVRKQPYIQLDTAEFEPYGGTHVMKCKWKSPILYYRAAPGRTPSNDVITDIYDFGDNASFIETYTGRGGADVDPLAVSTSFYNYIKNPQITAKDVPYNANKFILVSAGRDGIYGNDDDIANFERKPATVTPP